MTRTASFPTPAPLDLRVRNAAGTIEVTAADTDTSTVEIEPIDDSAEARELVERGRIDLSSRADKLVVEVPERRGLFSFRQPRVAVRVTVPTGSRVVTGAASADVHCFGRLGMVTAHTASGDIGIGDVDGPVEVHLQSGRLRVGSAAAITVRTASGAVDVGRASGEVQVRAASGTVHIGVAESSVRVQSASGRVAIDEARRGRVALTAASGDLRVGVPAGVVAHLDLSSISGRVRSELPVEDVAPEEGAPLDIQARTASGDLLVTSAGPTD